MVGNQCVSKQAQQQQDLHIWRMRYLVGSNSILNNLYTQELNLFEAQETAPNTKNTVKDSYQHRWEQELRIQVISFDTRMILRSIEGALKKFTLCNKKTIQSSQALEYYR